MILGRKKFFYPYKGSGLRFFGEKFFLDHVTFLIPHTLFVILDILDIPDEFGVKKFFLKNDLDLEIFRSHFFTTTFFRVFSYRFSTQKFPTRDVLDIEFFGAFCGL